MAQTFTDPPKNFAAKTGDASRYAKQLAALEQRWFNAGRETASWRIMTFVATGIAVAATAGALFVASQRPTAAVHVVEIDSRTGEPLRHRQLGEPVRPNDALISHMIGRWVQLTRAKSVDPVVLRTNWDHAYQFVPVSAKAEIDVYARDVDAFNPETLGKEAVTVEIASVTRHSKESFQIRWRETTFTDGRQQKRQSYTANVAVDFLPPETPRQIQINPLGLMITSIFLQPDFTTEESAS